MVEQVTIGGNNYDVYANVATADIYLAADIQYSAIWSAASTDTKSSALVSATRKLDCQEWLGEKTVPAQPLEFPRTGISGVDDSVVPEEIIEASIILAAMSVQNSSALNKSSTENLIKKVKAGSAETEFFRSTQKATLFPTNVQCLVDDLLSGGTSVVGNGISSGFTGTSIFTDEPFSLNKGIR